MKRYRALSYDIDFRATHLSLEMEETWDPEIKEMHHQNREQLVRGFVTEFGAWKSESKMQNLIELGDAPFSIIAFHNQFLRQIRNAFVIGAYYPALTGVCSLGERVLNQLLLNLRDFYRATREYKNVYRKSSFDNWQVAIDALEAWKVLLPESVANYRRLAKLRNRAIHFNPKTDHNDRELALEAIQIFSKIIDEQFTVFGTRPWFISGTPGVSFIKKEAETEPFVRIVYLPNCALVGPYHTLEYETTSEGTRWKICDEFSYEQKEISDEEFVELVNNKS